MSTNSASPTSPPTPETLTRHELNGLPVRVVDASNADAIGISGHVVSETQKTLVIEGSDGRERQVPKDGATFEFALPSEDDESDETGRKTGEPGDRTYVTVEGVRLVANPARRTERKRRSKWR